MPRRATRPTAEPYLVKRVSYNQTDGRALPYLIYADHDHREIVLAVRDLNLAKESNRLGIIEIG